MKTIGIEKVYSRGGDGDFEKTETYKQKRKVKEGTETEGEKGKVNVRLHGWQVDTRKALHSRF